MKLFLSGFKSRSIVLVLLMGNLALGLTTVLQARTIQDQKQLIHLLFRDSLELTSYKVAAVVTANKKR
jgi:hypothetical protein